MDKETKQICDEFVDDMILKEEYKMEDKIKKLIEKYSKINHNEFDSIQKVLSEKERGNLDINLDIEMKIRSSRHNLLVEIGRDLDKLNSIIERRKNKKC